MGSTTCGTIGCGDYLKEVFPTNKVAASEALQCLTLLLNSYGGHRIEGIGAKHVPWIHNLRNTDGVNWQTERSPLRRWPSAAPRPGGDPEPVHGAAMAFSAQSAAD